MKSNKKRYNESVEKWENCTADTLCSVEGHSPEAVFKYRMMDECGFCKEFMYEEVSNEEHFNECAECPLFKKSACVNDLYFCDNENEIIFWKMREVVSRRHFEEKWKDEYEKLRKIMLRCIYECEDMFKEADENGYETKTDGT